MDLRTTARDYLVQLQKLLPPGPAWSGGVGASPGGMLTNLLHGFAEELSRVNNRALALLEESDPRTVSEMLVAWERATGVPDSCEPAVTLTFEQRRLRVYHKWVARGGQTPAYFIAVAAALGVPITIEEFRPAQAGRTRAGEPVYGVAWWFTWRVFIPGVIIRHARASVTHAGERIRTWGNEIITCVLEKLKPAHTEIIFAYTPLVVDFGRITEPATSTIDHGAITDAATAVEDHGLITEP